MATNNNSNRYPSENKGRFSKEKPSFFWSGYFSGQALWLPYTKHLFISLPMNLV